MEAHGRVGRARALEHFHVFIDADDGAGRYFVERMGHRRREKRAVGVAYGDLARQGFRMAFAGENAAAQSHLFLLAPAPEVELVRGARKKGVGMGLFV
ncbi:hypothetical protein D9M68_901670 [compost metagenome]